MTLQIVQVAGAILILTAFIAAQRGAWSPHARPYLVLNLVGAAVLTGTALYDQDWGFVLLEGVWTAVSAHSLVQVLRDGGAQAAA